MTSLEQILKESYGVTEDDFSKALKLQEDMSGQIGRILVQIGSITNNQLTEALSKSLDMPLFDSNWEEDEGLVSFLITKLSYNYLLRNNVLPIKIDHDRKVLSVATDDPYNTSVSDYIVKNLGYRVSMYLATEETIKDFSRSYNNGQ
ncbi:MAG: type II/IV secretion system protein, partial [Syntrophales bacterium LBB04]|nr:type II/IV secretion system protein [Syntrophales bacterium LBB04]